MQKKKAIIYVIVALILFQDALSAILYIKAIDYLDELIVVGLVCIAILNIWKKRFINKNSFIILILIFCFSVTGILSCYINSNFVFKDVLMSNFLSIKFLLVTASIMNIDITYDTKKEFENTVIFYSKVVIVVGIFNFILPGLYKKIFVFPIVMYRMGLPCVTSLFRHPGTYGWFMLLVSLIYYSRYIETKSKKDFKKFVICVIFAFLSFRVKVVLGFVSILIYSVIFLNRKKINVSKIILMSIVVGIVLVLSSSLLEYAYYMYFTKEFGESARMSLNSNAIQIFKDYFPIGVGFGKFGSWYARIKYSEHYYNYKMTHIYGLSPSMPFFATDTYWPSIIGETGFIGTGIFISIIIYILKKIKRKYIRGNNIIEKCMCNFAILVLVQSIIESSSEAIFNNSPQFLVIAVAIGFALNTGCVDESNTRKNVR